MKDTWLICVDRGDGSMTRISEHDDMEHICRRIGQMVLSTDIEQIVVYKNGEEHRRYELKRKDVSKDRIVTLRWIEDGRERTFESTDLEAVKAQHFCLIVGQMQGIVEKIMLPEIGK